MPHCWKSHVTAQIITITVCLIATKGASNRLALALKSNSNAIPLKKYLCGCYQTSMVHQHSTWSQGYKTLFILNSTEHEILTAYKN